MALFLSRPILFVHAIAFATSIVGAASSYAHDAAAANASATGFHKHAKRKKEVNLFEDDARYVKERQEKMLPVWVHAFARSGSSTALSMVSKVDAPNGVFSLFEPCHDGDEMTDDLAEEGCSGLLSTLAKCDFRKIRWLHGWTDIHTLTGGLREYSPESASANCLKSDMVTFKTVTMPYETQESVKHVLKGDDRLKVVNIVRDPRSIYSSWFSTWPFNTQYTRDYKAMQHICDAMADSVDHDDSRLMNLVFEDTINDPKRVMQDLYKFLDQPFGEKQLKWISETFGANDCPGVDQYIAAYSDCHTDSRSSLDKWKQFLNEDERRFFRIYEPCQKVRRAFKYAED